MKGKKLFLAFLFLLVLFYFTSGMFAYADTVEFGKSGTEELPKGDLCTLIQNSRLFLWGIGLVVAVVMYIIAGIMYLKSGGENSKVATAKKILTWTSVGLVVLLIAGLIPETIGSFFGIDQIGGC